MRSIRSTRYFLVLVLFLSAALTGCGRQNFGVPPAGALIIQVSAHTSLASWLSAAAQEFNASKPETAAGIPIWVELSPVEAGQAVSQPDLLSQAALWIADDMVWVEISNGDNPGRFLDCQSIAQSPLVIAMWQPLAESLGWPGRDVGWLDVGSLAADPSAWTYYSGGQFGPSLRLGHTHPGLSGTGTATLLALVHSARNQSAAVGVADIDQPIVHASVGAFEGAVSWFSISTQELADAMVQRGSSFLGAAVVYESDVLVQAGSNSGIIPIYPVEGTFVARNPGCINSSLSLESQEAALTFRTYLLSGAGSCERRASAFALRWASSHTMPLVLMWPNR